MSHRRVDGREDDMVKSMAIASYGDGPIRTEGLQAYKEVPRASLRRSCQKRLASWQDKPWQEGLGTRQPWTYYC
jgi:hypothetical protein